MASMQVTHILYHYPYSIFSIMVRYGFAERGPAIDEEHEICIDERSVDITKNLEQMSEQFLCDVNANGEVRIFVPFVTRILKIKQVPVIVPLDTETPLPDSLAITKYLAKSYPTMIPQQYESQINELLHDLHGISVFSLTFAGRFQVVEGMKANLRKRREGDISDRYRAAIDYKIARVETKNGSALTPQASRENEEYTTQVLAKLNTLVRNSHTQWIFGLDRPSALDTHSIVLIARLLDIGRDDLVPDALRSYGKKAMSRPEWHQVMQGRTTSPL